MTKKKGLRPRLFIDESSSLYAGLAALEPALIRSRLIYLAKLGLQAENRLLNRDTQVKPLRGHSDKFTSIELIEEVNSNVVPNRHSCPKIINRHSTVKKQPTAIDDDKNHLGKEIDLPNKFSPNWLSKLFRVK